MTTRRVSGRRAARTSAGSVVPSAAQGTRSNSTPSSAKAVSGRSTELCSREEHTTCPGDLLNIPFKTMLSACVAFMVKITREGSEIPHNLIPPVALSARPVPPPGQHRRYRDPDWHSAGAVLPQPPPAPQEALGKRSQHCRDRSRLPHSSSTGFRTASSRISARLGEVL